MSSRITKGLDAQGLESYYGSRERRPYRPTTREARKPLLPEEEAKIVEIANRVRAMIEANEP